MFDQHTRLAQLHRPGRLSWLLTRTDRQQHLARPNGALIGMIGVIMLLRLALLHKELKLTSYDPTYTETIGLHADRIRLLLLILLALTVVTCIQMAGVILTSALRVTPAAAPLLTTRLTWMILLAALIAVGSALVGLYASYYANAASSAAIG
ncbi:MAG: metal ABC transporter permease [Chloroflexales bacterium]|nr:metal ABC transporter permease [Chloroflexales bacterium]